MSRKKRIVFLILGIVAVLAVLVAIVGVISMNYHEIYVFGEKIGLFCDPIEIKEKNDVEDYRFYEWDELREDERISFDQSLMLVDTEHLLPEGFVPDVLEYKDTTVYMSSCMLDAYAELSAAVKEKTGNKLYVSSDLRTSEEQEALYKEDPNTATIPGASEHQTGLALDVYVAYYAGDAFIKSPSGRFVNSNAHEYGFIIRYPSYGEEITGIRYEPWHIRYVGLPHSMVIYNNHLTLEEYVELLDEGKWYETEGYLVSRQVASGEGIYLPEGFETGVISYDNTGCVIITVK